MGLLRSSQWLALTLLFFIFRYYVNKTKSLALMEAASS